MNALATTTDDESPRQAIDRIWEASGGTKPHSVLIVDYLEEQWQRGRIASAGAMLASPELAFGGTPAFQGTTFVHPSELDAMGSGGGEPSQIVRPAVFRRFHLAKELNSNHPGVVTGSYIARGCAFDDHAYIDWAEPYDGRGDWARVDQLEALARDLGAKLEWLDQ